jgi:hypothetical protein
LPHRPHRPLHSRSAKPFSLSAYPERLTNNNVAGQIQTILRRIHSTSCPTWPTKDPDSQLYFPFGYHKSTNERPSQNSRARNDHESASPFNRARRKFPPTTRSLLCPTTTITSSCDVVHREWGLNPFVVFLLFDSPWDQDGTGLRILLFSEQKIWNWN